MSSKEKSSNSRDFLRTLILLTLETRSIKNNWIKDSFEMQNHCLLYSAVWFESARHAKYNFLVNRTRLLWDWELGFLFMSNSMMAWWNMVLKEWMTFVDKLNYINKNRPSTSCTLVMMFRTVVVLK